MMLRYPLGLLCLTLVFARSATADWPQFRGPNNNGVAADVKLPTVWSETQNTVWRVDLPGRGPSSPIVVGSRVFVTATTGVRHDRLHVLCFDVQTGDRLWQRQFWATGRTATHESISGAAPTPASDGQRVFAFYSSNDLIGLDLDGNLLWYRGLSHDFPKSGNDIGMASSPTVADGVVVVQIESQGDSFATGIDAATGESRWRVDREQHSCWTSPIALPGAGPRPTTVLLQSTAYASAHDIRTGTELWRLDSDCAGIASSVYADDLLLVPMKGLSALRLSGTSVFPETVWDSNRMRPGSSSPLIHDGRVYVISNATVRCGDARNGELLWSVRLKGTHWATPVLAGNHLYCINQDGEAQVVRLDEKQGEIVGENRFGETIHASPAVADNALFVRSDKHLWKIGL